MTAEADFPAVDAFVRWARRQHASGQMSADQLVRQAMVQYERNPVLLEAFVREALTYFTIEVATGQKPELTFRTNDYNGNVNSVSEAPERLKTTRERSQRVREILEMERAGTFDNAVSAFFERHPEAGVVVPILQMTREELLQAATVRDVESARARQRAALCREVAQRLAPGQIAQEVVSESDLQQIEKTITDAEAPKPFRRSA